MYCKNCGRQVSDNAKFCPYCGTSLKGQPETVNGSNADKAPRNNGSDDFNKGIVSPAAVSSRVSKPIDPRTKKKFIAAVIAIAIICIAAAGGSMIYKYISRPTIDLSKYVSLYDEDFDNNTYSIDINEDYVGIGYQLPVKEVLEKAKIKYDPDYGEEMDDEGNWLDPEYDEKYNLVSDLLYDSIEYKLDKKNGLVNGDKVNVTIGCKNKKSIKKLESELNVNFTGFDKTVVLTIELPERFTKSSLEKNAKLIKGLKGRGKQYIEGYYPNYFPSTNDYKGSVKFDSMYFVSGSEADEDDEVLAIYKVVLQDYDYYDEDWDSYDKGYYAVRFKPINTSCNEDSYSNDYDEDVDYEYGNLIFGDATFYKSPNELLKRYKEGSYDRYKISQLDF